MSPVTVLLISGMVSSTTSLEVLDVGAPRTGAQSRLRTSKNLTQFLEFPGLMSLFLELPHVDLHGSEGTQTMHAALGMLGLKTLHSGYEFAVRTPWCEYLYAGGPLEDALATLEGYDAAMDEPFQLVYEEILQAFPKSKFILTILDPEKWYESYTNLAHAMPSPPQPPYLEKCTAARYWGCDFFGNATEESKKQCLEACDEGPGVCVARC